MGGKRSQLQEKEGGNIPRGCHKVKRVQSMGEISRYGKGKG